MYEKKFAVTRCIGNTEHILRCFAEEEKEAALAFGREVAETNAEGVITCVRAVLDADGRFKDGACEVFEVWPAKK